MENIRLLSESMEAEEEWLDISQSESFVNVDYTEEDNFACFERIMNHWDIVRYMHPGTPKFNTGAFSSSS